MFKDPKFWLNRLILLNGVHVDPSSWHLVIILISLVLVTIIFSFIYVLNQSLAWGQTRS